MTQDESAPDTEASLVDEPEVRQALAEADRASVASVVAEHPSSPLAWAELADLADSEGNPISAFAFAAVAVDLAREQLTASGWTPGGPVPWSDEPNRAYLRALDAQRRAATQLGLDDRAARLADELADADAEAPARIASEFTPTQLMPIVGTAGLFEATIATETTEATVATEATEATEAEPKAGHPTDETHAADAAGED